MQIRPVTQGAAHPGIGSRNESKNFNKQILNTSGGYLHN